MLAIVVMKRMTHIIILNADTIGIIITHFPKG